MSGFTLDQLEKMRVEHLRHLEDNLGDAYTLECNWGHSWRVSRKIPPITLCPHCWMTPDGTMVAKDIHPDVQAEWDKQFAHLRGD